MASKAWDFKNDELTCSFCGKSKKGISFLVAPCEPGNWSIHMIYQRISCPDCYVRAREEYGQARDTKFELEDIKEQVKSERKDMEGMR